jgi:hypothetical protein
MVADHQNGRHQGRIKHRLSEQRPRACKAVAFFLARDTSLLADLFLDPQ